MALTLSDIREEVDKNHGGRFSQEDSSFTRMDRQINLTVKRLARVRDWKELYTSDTDSVIITGTPSTDVTYSLPTGLKELYALMVDDGNTDLARKLSRIPNRQWNQIVGQSELHSTGSVTMYSVWRRSAGQSVAELFRVPNQNYTLYRKYSVWPTEMVDAGDTPTLENKDDLIIADTTLWFFQSLGKAEDAANWAGIRTALFQEAVAEDAMRPDEGYIWRGGSEVTDDGVDYWNDPFIRRNP